MNMKFMELKRKDLRLFVDPDSLEFDCLSQVKGHQEVNAFGQQRAVEAMEFGLRVRHPDFNIFVAGSKETGLMELAEDLVKKAAFSVQNTPSDWVYCYNFKHPDSPVAIELPKGKGAEFKADMAQLIEDLKLQIPQIFESETYVNRKEEVVRAFNKARNQVFEDLDQKAKANGFILQADQTGMVVIPAKEDGSPYTSEDLQKLPLEKQEELKKKSEYLHREMGNAMRHIHHMEQDVRKKLKDLDRELVAQTTQGFIQRLREKYHFSRQIQEYLDGVQADVVKNMDAFRPRPQGAAPFPFPGMEPSFTQYDVNLFVDNSETEGIPVIIETNPSYTNLFGTVERKAQFGALFTDFTMIKAGSIHKANGGFLMIKALDLLKRPFSYEALKRAIKERKVEIEDIGEQFGLFTTKALKPKTIPLDVKIVLVGDPMLYQILYNLDEDFREIFKVKAHMDIHIEKKDERIREFCHELFHVMKRCGLTDLHKSAVARLIEYSAELAGARDKLSLKIKEIEDLLIECDFWARQEGADTIMARHVEQAIEKRRYRNSLYEDHLKEYIQKDKIKVETTGYRVGQINGLSVYDLGNHVFGRPSRITATVSLGKEGVVNIEREADLSGNIHTKGVMILAGYLRSVFAKETPLALTATLCFEQSYGLVDGDSASGAELFALLSALSDCPIDQGKAVTGAVSQKGEILPVGGVTQKIEGFFDICKAKGLTGNQGVIIPRANIENLLLKNEVIEAVEGGGFHIWAAETVEEAMELLTGVVAGKRDEHGDFPEDSLFFKVEKRLKELAVMARMQENPQITQITQKETDKGDLQQ